MFEGAEVISSYTAQQAVEDGILIEVPEDIKREHAVLTDVFMTSNLYHAHAEFKPIAGILDAEGAARMTHLRMSQLVRAARVAFLAGDPQDFMRTNIFDHGVNYWAVIDGAGLTLMLPEDY